MSSRIRLIVADDSPFMCRLLSSLLDEHAGFDVVASAGTGAELIRKVAEHSPDVVTMGLSMPDMDGLEAVARIMREQPVPIVVISGASGRSAEHTIRALDLGAVEFIRKFRPGARLDPNALAEEISAKIRLAARTKVIRLLQGNGRGGRPSGFRVAPAPAGTARPIAPGGRPRRVVIIGSSTGGPRVLHQLLTGIGAVPAGVAIIIVQHMPAGFTAGLAQHLSRVCGLDVREFVPGEPVRAGTIRVAPGGMNLAFSRDGVARRLSTDVVSQHSPSIDMAMETAVQAFGDKTVGVILTGLGSDGARGLATIHRSGGVTFAQEPSTCVVEGMPKSAIALGVAHYVAPPEELGRLLSNAPLTAPGATHHVR